MLLLSQISFVFLDQFKDFSKKRGVDGDYAFVFADVALERAGKVWHIISDDNELIVFNPTKERPPHVCGGLSFVSFEKLSRGNRN